MSEPSYGSLSRGLARTRSSRAAGSPSSALRPWTRTPTRSTGATSRSGTRAYPLMPSLISGSRWRLGTPRSKVGSLPGLTRRPSPPPSGAAGGASPVVVPAAVATVMVDVAFITRLQLRLAYDIAVLYRVPIDLSDPDDMWKLIRVAFTIKGGEAAREGVVKVVPLIVRPLIKRFYSGAVLAAAKGLPVVGKFLLQRTVIKIGIPLVGVPLAVVLNRYTTLVTGRHARAVFRNEARVIELAENLSERSQHPQLMLWVAWLVIMADGKITDDEALLMRHLVRLVHDRHQVADEKLARRGRCRPRRGVATPRRRARGSERPRRRGQPSRNRGWCRQRPRTRNDLRASRSVRARPALVAPTTKIRPTPRPACARCRAVVGAAFASQRAPAIGTPVRLQEVLAARSHSFSGSSPLGAFDGLNKPFP